MKQEWKDGFQQGAFDWYIPNKVINLREAPLFVGHIHHTPIYPDAIEVESTVVGQGEEPEPRSLGTGHNDY